MLGLVCFAVPWTLLACQGCRGAGGLGPGTDGAAAPSSATAAAETPTLRLVVVSDLAGAIEPCGCVKDQLGGLDHLAAFLSVEKKRVPATAVVAAGPLFFLDPSLAPDKKEQDVRKATTLASSLAYTGLVAFAPGRNDWAGGPEVLEKLRVASGASLVGGNLDGVPAEWRGPALKEIGGVKVGFAGASALSSSELGAPAGVSPSEVVPAVRAQVDALKKQGAEILIAIAATGRGEAKRLADGIPELTAVIVGSPSARGEGNTEAPPPERIGEVIIAEAGNHLTSAVLLDFYVRGRSFKFADGSGLEEGRKRSTLLRRSSELRGRIAQWESDGKIQKADLDARRAELAKIEAEAAALDTRPPPATGSYFRYSVLEVRTSLGSDKGVQDRLSAYYKEVNEANRIAFAGKLPPPVPAGQPKYVGIETCDACHVEPREVWDKTRHAKAYATLVTDHKEFNLDCVSCHVTGYDKPGGSTVTHVKDLENVQCEVCHGPGSLHSKNPNKVAMPIAKPEPEQCLACHHPPHVHEFDAKARMADILGPGHGKK
ncbi:MAG: multiheme c-type cytochrome [Polyangiaceae bacterium]